VKIVFNIKRQNWYRVLASSVNEALRRGHDVELWLNVAEKTLGKNVVEAGKVPIFRSGVPIVTEYHGLAQFEAKLLNGDIDAIIDLHPLEKDTMKKLVEKKSRTKVVMLDCPPTDCIWEINSEEQLSRTDLIAGTSEYWMRVASEMMAIDRGWLIKYAVKNKDRIGNFWIKFLCERFNYQWQSDQIKALQEKTRIVGWPALDDLNLIDVEYVRRNWRIPLNKKVVCLLPCPFGDAFQAPWEKIFASRSITKWLLNACVLIAKNRMSKRFIPPVTDFMIVNALRKFCDNNNAWLLVKKRHSQILPSYLQKRAERIIGEDGYHPHTALQAFAIANVTVGYYSLGAIESIATGTPYLNIEIPGFPAEWHFEYSRPGGGGHFAHAGASFNMNASDAMKQLPKLTFDNFKMDVNARDSYMIKYAGTVDGRSSMRFLETVEELIKHNSLSRLQ
jgi:hypothetical protein